MDTNTNFTQPVIDIRLKIDQLLNSFAYILPSRECSLAKTSLQFAFAWLGESLKETGSKSPYVESENPESDKIEPQADHTENSLRDEFANYNTHTARVKLYRSKLTEIITEIKNAKAIQGPYLTFNDCLDNAVKYAIEAKFSFGWELGRIMELKDNQGNSPSFTQGAQPLPL
jgi:hypothetical protein